MPILPDWRAQRQHRRARLVSLALLLLAAGAVVLVERRAGGRRTGPPVPLAGATSPGGSANQATPQGLIVLSLRGTPGEIGRQHGAQLREPIRRLLRDYLRSPLWRQARLDAKARQALAQAKAATLPQSMVDQLQGIAEGAGVPYLDLVLWQSWADLAVSGDSAAYAAMAPAMRNRNLQVGYRLDNRQAAALRDPLVLMAVREEGGGAWAGVGLPGQAAPLVGMNAGGLVAALLHTATGPETGADRPPGLAVLRGLLQNAGNLTAARYRVERLARPAQTILLLAQTRPTLESTVLEVTTEKSAARKLTDGLSVATNHLRLLRKPPLKPTDRGVCARYDQLRAWLMDHSGSIHDGSDPLAAAGLTGPAGVLHVLVEPLNRTLSVSRGDGAQRVWARYAWDISATTLTLVSVDPAAAP